MIKSFYIEDLYGLFTYNLVFRKGVFIITGPNGFGKTTILRCLNDVFQGDFWRFYYLKFNSIKIEFDDGKRLEMTREEKDVFLFDEFEKEANVSLSFFSNQVAEKFEITYHYLMKLIRYQSKREINDVEKYLYQNYDIRFDDSIRKAAPRLVRYVRLLKCSFVGSQRLVYGTKPLFGGDQYEMAYTIDDVNERIREVYMTAQNDFSKQSQSIDGSFISRLSELINNNNAGLVDDVNSIDLQQRIDDYRRYHLLEETNVEVLLPSSYEVVRRLYLNDIKSKLNSLSKYYEQLSAFDMFVTGKELSYKRIELSENGIEVIGDNGDSIPLNKLSSGEQNLIILGYRLIFESSKGEVLLIDEPENSLHMSWLENLLEEYIRIAKTSGCQVIIATHSPTFIGSRWDLSFDLFENNLKSIL